MEIRIWCKIHDCLVEGTPGWWPADRSGYWEFDPPSGGCSKAESCRGTEKPYWAIQLTIAPYGDYEIVLDAA